MRCRDAHGAATSTPGPALTIDSAELDSDRGQGFYQDQSSLDDLLQEAERTHILRALELANWVVAGPNGAAARLGINRSTLLSRMQRLGIRVSRNYVASRDHVANWRPALA